MRVIKIGAEWCAGCIVMRPIWKEVEEEAPWLKTEYFDYDQNQAEVEKYEVNDILPTFIFLDKENHEIMRITGERTKDEIMELIEEHKDK